MTRAKITPESKISRELNKYPGLVGAFLSEFV